MAGMAERKGLTRLLIVYEKHGNPHSLNFWSDGEWLNPVVLIKAVQLRDKGRIKLPKEITVKAEGADGKKIAKLFAFEEPETDDAVVCKLSAERIEFEYEGEHVGPVVEIRGLIDERQER